MKKSVRVALLAGVSATALSLAPMAEAQAQTAFDGFYGGVSLGYHYFDATNVNNDFVACCSANTNPVSDQHGDGLIGGIFGGFGQTYNNQFYVGGEAEFSYSGASKGFPVNNFGEGCGQPEGNAKISAKDSYGLALRFGYLVTPNILGYVRVGPQWTRFSAQYHNLQCDAPNLSEQSKVALGGRVGLGGEMALGNWIGQQLFARLEYTHTIYESVRVGAPGPSFGRQTIRFDPTDDIVRFGLGIHF